MKAFVRLTAYSPNRPVVALSQRLTATSNLRPLARYSSTAKSIPRGSSSEKQSASYEQENGYDEPAKSAPTAPFQESEESGTSSLELDNPQNWAKSFHGLSTQPFATEISTILMGDLDPDDIEIKPDGLLYLPEIKYRRILNKAFGPGGWGLAPRGEHSINEKNVSREYALICQGRFVSQARGEQDYFDPAGLPTATEGCKSNALMRCCKDLGIGSELWDPTFIRKFKKKYCTEVWVEHVVNKKKKRIWIRKDSDVEYPFKASQS